MTRLQFYEYALIECNKNQAPSLLVDDYNYLIRKAIYNYIERNIKINEIDQKSDDNLRVLKTPYFVTDKTLLTTYGVDKTAYQFLLPVDYLHLKNCIVVYNITKPYGCYNINDKITWGASRMTAEVEPVFSWNYYIVPKWELPYYYVNNPSGAVKKINVINNPDEKIIDNVRNVNSIPAGIEIHTGKLPSYITVEGIRGWYFKVPENITLTQNDIDSDYDNTPHMEFPDHVCYEIIKELVILILEHDSNPRLQTNIPINMTSNANQQ